MARRGFTLIELLVVIAIIAILAAILFPVFVSAKAQAQQATCKSNLKQLATACQLYSEDNGGRFPNCYWFTPNWTDNSIWFFTIPKYISSRSNQKGWTDRSRTGVFMCPSCPKQYPNNGGPRGLGYAMNMGVSSADMGQLQRSTKTVLITDGGPDTVYINYGVYDPNGLPDPCGTGWMANAANIDPRQCRSAKRHSEGANFVLCDGHVQWSKLDSAFFVDVKGTVRALDTVK